MQLEELCVSLGIAMHIPALSEFRDNLLRGTAEELQLKEQECDKRIKESDSKHAEKINEFGVTIKAMEAELKSVNSSNEEANAVLAESAQKQAALIERVREAHAAGDIDALVGIAVEVAEPLKAAELAEAAELEAKANALREKYAPPEP